MLPARGPPQWPASSAARLPARAPGGVGVGWGCRGHGRASCGGAWSVLGWILALLSSEGMYADGGVQGNQADNSVLKQMLQTTCVWGKAQRVRRSGEGMMYSRKPGAR